VLAGLLINNSKFTGHLCLWPLSIVLVAFSSVTQ
jgi:hypothetical protein